MNEEMRQSTNQGAPVDDQVWNEGSETILPLLEKRPGLENTFANMLRLANDLESVDQQLWAGDQEGKKSIFALPGEATVLKNKFVELKQIVGAQESPMEAAKAFFILTKGEQGGTGLYKMLHDIEDRVGYRRTLTAAGRAEQVGQTAETDQQYARLIADLRQWVINLAVQLLDEVRDENPPTPVYDVVLENGVEVKRLSENDTILNELENMKPVAKPEDMTPKDLQSMIFALKNYLQNEKISGENIDDFLRRFESPELMEVEKDQEAPFNFRAARENLDMLESYLNRLEPFINMSGTAYNEKFYMIMKQEDIQALYDDLIKRKDAMLQRRERLGAYADHIAQELHDAGGDVPITGGAEGLRTWLESMDQADGGQRANKVLRGLMALSGMSVEAMAKMIQESDLSTFIHFLVHGGDGRMGGGMTFEGKETEHALTKEGFDDLLRKKPTEFGKSLLRAYYQSGGLRDQGWRLEQELVDGLEQPNISPDVLRKVLVSLHVNFLGESAANLDTRERRWSMFGQVMIAQPLLKDMGVDGLGGQIAYEIREEAGRTGHEWEHVFGTPQAAAPAASAAPAPTATGENALPTGEVAATPV